MMIVDDNNDDKEERWLEGIKSAVNKHMFNHVQFICCEQDEEYGSGWQRMICKKIGAADDSNTEVFWNNKGMAEARKLLNRRRQNTNIAMKRLFVGKYCLLFVWTRQKREHTD